MSYKNPFFSIIIPALNEEVSLPTLLNSIAKQTFTDYEVLVVDSGSKDKTKEKALSFQKKIANFQFLDRKCKNVSQARNCGAASASGKYLIFFDADGEIEINFLKGIEKLIILKSLDCLTVWNRTKSKSITAKFILILLNLSMTLFQKVKPGASGTCIIMKKELFEKIGGFDERIVFGEDFHLVQKAHKIGANFAVFKTPLFYTSTRRFEKEGLFLSLYKSVKALVHQFFLGPIVKPIFDYEMGGQYYSKKKSEN